VAVVGEACGEGRAVVEGVGFLALGEFHLFLEGVDLVPEVEDSFFLLGEVGSLGDFGELGVHMVG
jgi:hypothetical protein